MTENGKPKLAMYWASSCGGCEISVLNIHENILAVDEIFDLAFFPCIADFKVSDVEGYPDNYIDVCLFNGAIRNSENEHMAQLLRQKSKVMVAYGACSHVGSIPALSNLTSREATLKKVFLDNPSLDNPHEVLPQTSVHTPEGELTLPEFYHTVKKLDQVVDVDYYLPGCPPEPPQIWAVLQVVAGALTQGDPLPPAGSVVGAGNSAVCDECDRVKHEKSIDRFYRPYEVQPDPEQCLLEQGIMCLGLATRSGCGALCPTVGMGCRGCYGPPAGVEDQGAKMLSAVASVIAAGDETMEEDELEKLIQEAVDTIADPSGTFYRFSMSHSILQRVKDTNGKGAA
jgi:F420-non-reducing hydrogenase small subunit